MKKTLPIIQSLWIGNTLSINEQLCINSFVKNGHEFHLYTYENITNIPTGTIIKDANEIIAKDLIFTYKGGSYAGFADWFRWKLLYEKGNFWVDMDVICLKSFNFKPNELIYGFEGHEMVCPAVLGFPKKHEFCKFLENLCKNPNQILPYDDFRSKKRKLKRKILLQKRNKIKWGECGGPEGVTKALKHFNLLKEAKPFTHFFPISYLNWNSIYNNDLESDFSYFSKSYAIHLWNEKTRKVKFNKNASHSKYSIIEQLKKKYL